MSVPNKIQNSLMVGRLKFIESKNFTPRGLKVSWLHFVRIKRVFFFLTSNVKKFQSTWSNGLKNFPNHFHSSQIHFYMVEVQIERFSFSILGNALKNSNFWQFLLKNTPSLLEIKFPRHQWKNSVCKSW